MDAETDRQGGIRLKTALENRTDKFVSWASFGDWSASEWINVPSFSLELIGDHV